MYFLILRVSCSLEDSPADGDCDNIRRSVRVFPPGQVKDIRGPRKGAPSFFV